MIAIDEADLRDDVRQWNGLVRTGAWAAYAGVALIAVQIVILLIWPPPLTALGYFELLLVNPLRGVLALDGLYLVSNLLAYLLYLALGVVL